MESCSVLLNSFFLPELLSEPGMSINHGSVGCAVGVCDFPFHA